MARLFYAGRIPGRTATIPATPVRSYVAAQGCSGCPYRTTCHEARQHANDLRFSVGRHYECEFHALIVASLRRASQAAMRPSWWRALRSGL